MIGVGGTLGQNTVWEDVQGMHWPYVAYSDVTVPADRSLSIDAGAVVKFSGPQAGYG